MTLDRNENIGNFQEVDGKLKTRREVLIMGALAATSVAAISQAQAIDNKQAALPPASASGVKTSPQYTAKDFSSLTAKKLDGLSTNQIEQHLKLYSGYVNKVNEIQTQLSMVDIASPQANATWAPYRELLVEQSFALNGVVYHELYFGNIGGTGGEPTGDLKSAIEDGWGSIGKFMDYFKAAGKCMRGWVIIGFNTRDGKLHAYGLDAHNLYVPASTIPIVVLDVYEHAYMIDYGINRASYLDAFLKNMDWDICAKRFAMARKHLSGPDVTA
jgi:Fe-Mn family superoxide dismutase